MAARWVHLAARPRTRRDGSGQILVLFGLSLVVFVAMAGLAVDAGGTFAQRRDQQAAADLAALAAANDYLINASEALAVARVETVAAANGYANGVDGTTVAVAIDTTVGVEIQVDIDAPHANTFLGIVGMSRWDVTTSASALAGFPDTGYGAAPFIFSIGAFEDDGTPRYQTERGFGDTNGHAPTSSTDFAWTNFGTGNVNTSEVRDIIQGDIVIDRAMAYGEYIGQYNNGNHSALFNDVDTFLSGKDMPVAVVDNNGNFMGWAMFHVSSASGGSTKQVRGYFLSSFVSASLRITTCELNACPRYLGAYVLKLSD